MVTAARCDVAVRAGRPPLCKDQLRAGHRGYAEETCSKIAGMAVGQSGARSPDGGGDLVSADVNIDEAFGCGDFFQFRDGKIAYYRGSEDTAQTEAVLRD